MRIVIVGAGALGCLLAARLSPVARVWLMTSWVEHAAAIRQHGLTFVALDGTSTQIATPVVEAPAVLPEPADLALIAVKSHSTQQAAHKAQAALADHGLALTLQNGLGNLEVIAGVLGAGRAAQGVTAQGATLLGPGRVRHAGQGPTHLAASPLFTARIEQTAQLFRAAGLETYVTDSLESLLWGKLVVNAGINALTAILRLPNGLLAELPPARALMAAAASEAAAVAQAKGIALPFDDPAARAEAVAIATARNRSSMLQDVLRGAPTEIEVINGAVVREGERVGAPTPVNRLLLQLVRAIEQSHRQRL